MKPTYYKINTGIFPDVIKVCFSDEQFQQILKDHNIDEKATAFEFGGAETHFLKVGATAIVIGVFSLAEMGEDVGDISGTLAHEASHIIDGMAELIGEDHITNEIRAYFMQYLVKHLWTCVHEEKAQNAREQNRKLSKQTGRKGGGIKPKVDQHNNGGAGQDSDVKKTDPVRGTKIEQWAYLPQAKDSIFKTSQSGVSSYGNKLF